MLSAIALLVGVGACLGAPEGPYPGPVGPYPGPEGPYPAPSQPVLLDQLIAVTTAQPIAQETPLTPLVIPKNTQIKIQDDRLQYTHGFNDDITKTSVSEQGRLFSTNDGWEYVIIKKGSYSYISPEGTPIVVNYVADHNGYRIIGELRE